MSDTKQKLIDLVSALQEENIIDYCYTFTGLKVYGVAKLPDSITAKLRQMWGNCMLHEEQQEERHEQTAEEKQAGEIRCNITRMLYDTKNLATLKFILSTICLGYLVGSGALKEKYSPEDSGNVVDYYYGITEMLKHIDIQEMPGIYGYLKEMYFAEESEG